VRKSTDKTRRSRTLLRVIQGEGRDEPPRYGAVPGENYR